MNRLIRAQFLILIPFLLASCVNHQPDTQQPVAPIMPEFIDNCLVGCPLGGSNETVIRQAYTLNNNSGTKFANWVAYKITKVSQASNHPRNWKQDPDLPASDTLKPADYTGANAALAVDRGHQAPLASLSGASDWASLNYLSNITPQKSALNQGAWAKLEEKERALAARSDVKAVYSVTGPLFGSDIGVLPAAPEVKIPDGYWKIIFIGDGPDKGKYSAFLLPQNVARSANFCDYQVAVKSIEVKTNPHLTIWSELPTNIAAIIKAQNGTLAKDEMGCQ